jgi:hypothetical protein
VALAIARGTRLRAPGISRAALRTVDHIPIRTSANTPEDICLLFSQYMREGDIDSVLSVYDPNVVFLIASGYRDGAWTN